MRKVISSKKSDFGGLHFTLNHTGKMTGLQSISTSVLANHNCEVRRQNGDTICSHCFAAAMMKRYAGMQKAFIENTNILTSRILADNEIPIITSNLFRFEAFGDLNNTTQVINYFKIAALNPSVHCALWTKNPRYISEAIKAGYNKPANLQIVLSSTFTNKVVRPGFDFIDKVFTVYDSKTITERNININCGARSCAVCQRCYHKNSEAVEYINEKLK